MLQEALQLEISLGRERGNLRRLSEDAHIAEDAEKKKEYSDKFNSFQSDHQEEYRRLSQLWTQYYENFPSSEHTVVDVLRSTSYRPFETTQSQYEKMNNEALNSYFGEILKREIDKIAGLQPGKDAPDFHLIAMDGREISLRDCAGSYVLIYHWGICPGSFQKENEVTDLYNRYKDKLIVVGITERIEIIKQMYEDTKPENNEMKPILESMLAHPWFDAEKTGNNGKIETDYAITGLPYFVFISPEGKIIARAPHEAFYVAKSTMETELNTK